MPTDKFEEKKNKLFEKLKTREELDAKLEEEIKDIYGARGERAINVIKNGRVRQKDGRWFVEGREDEYEIVKSHCSCYDYVLNIATQKTEVDMCYHALAKNIFELLNSKRGTT